MGEAGRVRIAVFVNPRSRANRRNPHLAAEFQAIVGETGRVLAPQRRDDLDDMARALRAAPPEVIAIHGGDGTLHAVITALGRAWGDDPLPPITLLSGGTMNVVAASLGIAGDPRAVLKVVTESVRAGRPLDLVRRRCLRVGDRLGFVFGNGLMANFLGEYYATGRYGPTRAVWLILRTFLSITVYGPFARRIFRRFEGEVRVDGVTLPRTRFVGVGAATVREVGLGFKLNHRADDDPERFGVLAIHSAPLALVADLKAVHDGRGIAPARAFSAVASVLDVAPRPSGKTTRDISPKDTPSGEMSYTIDGDLYTSDGPLRITVGPPVAFVDAHLGARARRALPPAPQSNTNTTITTTTATRVTPPPAQLIGATPGDTMKDGR